MKDNIFFLGNAAPMTQQLITCDNSNAHVLVMLRLIGLRQKFVTVYPVIY